MKRNKRIQFWGRDENDDQLLDQVLEGKKTATATPSFEYSVPLGEFDDGGYVIGDLVEVYDLRCNLRCQIRITEEYETKLSHIPEKLWQGECNESAEEFKKDHIYCWSEHCPDDDFEFIVNHFELVKCY